MQGFFVEPPLIIAPMPEFNVDEEPAANEIEPELEAAIDAVEEQPVIVSDEPNNIDDDEQH